MTEYYAAPKGEEVFKYGPFGTGQEAADECARQCGLKKGATILVGERQDYGVFVDPNWILDNLDDNARSECGESAEDWLAPVNYTKEDRDELEAYLLAVVETWLQRKKLTPHFFSIRNVQEFTLY